MNKYSLENHRHGSVDDYEDMLDARKAKAYASWSFIGILIPLLGWILAARSLSISKYLPEEGKIGRRRDSSRNIAKLSILLGCISALIYLVIALQANNPKQQPVGAQNEQPTQSSQQQDPTQQALQSCIDQAHQQWDGTIAIAEGGIDQEPYNFDKSQLDQEINNCHLQYGY